MNDNSMDLDDNSVENTSTVVRIGVEGGNVTLRFDVVGMDECVTQTLLMPPKDARYYANELARAAKFVEEQQAGATNLPKL